MIKAPAERYAGAAAGVDEPHNCESRRRSVVVGVVYGLLAAFMWGAFPVVTRLGVAHTLTAYDVAALRFSVAGLILLPLVWRRGAAGIGWFRASVLACGAGLPYFLVMAVGLGFAPAGHAGVIAPCVVLLATTMGSWLVLGDRPDRFRLSGIAASLAGVALIGWENLSSGQGGHWIGDLAFIAGGFLWASYTVASRAWSVEPVHATALVSVLSMVAYLPIYGILSGSQIFAAPLGEIVFQATFQGIAAGVLALICFTRAIAILGSSRSAMFSALVPGQAVLLAHPLLGEVPSGLALLGVAVTTFGMSWALGLWQPRIPPRVAPEHAR